MNKNQIFKKFIQNPLIKENVSLTEHQMKNMDLHTPSNDPLIEVIKTAILHMEENQSVDIVARKINQRFKKTIA